MAMAGPSPSPAPTVGTALRQELGAHGYCISTMPRPVAQRQPVLSLGTVEIQYPPTWAKRPGAVHLV
jgi:hypothetical protein